MNILIRDVPSNIVAALDAEAATKRLSRQDLLLDILGGIYGEPPAVVGWVQCDRRGELDGDCPECGQPVQEVWIGMLTNGTWIAPRCQWCATSE